MLLFYSKTEVGISKQLYVILKYKSKSNVFTTDFIINKYGNNLLSFV